VSPMCPVQCVTYVSDRSHILARFAVHGLAEFHSLFLQKPEIPNVYAGFRAFSVYSAVGLFEREDLNLHGCYPTRS
jgi:hypothetical protein